MLIITWILIVTLCHRSLGFLYPGKWSFSVHEQTCHYFQVHRAMFANSVIKFKVQCDSPSKQTVKVGWVVRRSPCFEEYLGPEVTEPVYLNMYYDCPWQQMGDFGYNEVLYLKKGEVEVTCDHLIDAQLSDDKSIFVTSYTNDTMACRRSVPRECKSSPPPPFSLLRFNENTNMNQPIVSLRNKRESNQPKILAAHPGHNSNDDHQIKITQDGVYIVILKVLSPTIDKLFDLTVDMELKGDYGYLSAIEYPLLHFYGIMCLVYVILAMAWLIVSAVQWRDLLRIQFWIGAVIFLGMIEKAVFYAEHHSVNVTGQSVKGAVLAAELLSCFKRTLARMLVIVVSLGFGIVKPRLGSMFHRVVTVGGLYFVLSALEAFLRVYRPKIDPENQSTMAGVPLAVLDSIICWWVFSALIQTMRTLRLRRNLVKLQLYRHFTNTLVIAVIASMLFMAWQIHSHKLTNCLSDWRNLWLDEAFWHVLFSLILLLIMILWRPTNNNQRYAFSPLLDPEDDDLEPFITQLEAFDGIKMRSTSASDNSNNDVLTRETEDDLKWVEENLTNGLVESALPVLMDSDEEILTAKFERNKME